jgi:hypothetical protein
VHELATRYKLKPAPFASFLSTGARRPGDNDLRQRRAGCPATCAPFLWMAAQRK